jgi:two-component system, NarL family, sensor kinase
MRLIRIISVTFLLNLFNSNELISQDKIDSLVSVLEASKDDSTRISIHQQLGSSYFWQGSYIKSLNHFQSVLKIKQSTGDNTELGSTYYELGKLSYYSKPQVADAKRSLEYLRTAFKYAVIEQDTLVLTKIMRGTGAILGELGLRDSCIYYLNQAIKIAQIKKDFQSASGLHNLIGTYYVEWEYKAIDVERQFNQSLHYAQLIENKEPLAFIKFKLGMYYGKNGQLEKGLPLTNESAEIYREIGLADGLLQVLAGQLKLMGLSADGAQTYSVFEEFKRLQDSLYNEQSNKAFAEMETKYQTEKKDHEIKTLAAESQLQELQIAQSRWVILGIVLISILLIAGLLLVNSRKRYKLKVNLAEEKDRIQKNRFKAVIDAEEKERKRIAQELHDGLGQILSTARLSISSLDEDEQNQNVQHSLKLIDAAVDETRTISHNMMPNALVSIGLDAALRDLVRNINQAGKIKAEIEIDQLPTIEESTSVTIYRIVQETINNALKYSNAGTLKVQLQVNTEMILTIYDNGKGFDTTNIENSGGIGWKNIYSRAGLINGNVSVFSKLGEGTTVKITIPIHESIKTATG